VRADAGAEFAVDVAQVRADGALREPEFRADVLVGQTAREAMKHLVLASRERTSGGAAARRRGRAIHARAQALVLVSQKLDLLAKRSALATRAPARALWGTLAPKAPNAARPDLARRVTR
jgi:hypothetical protein